MRSGLEARSRTADGPSVPSGHSRRRSNWLRRGLIATLILALGVGSVLVWSRKYIADQQAALAQRCRHAQADGDWPRLEELARQWASWQPQKSEPWIYAAEAARNMENPTMEAEYLRHIGDDAPLTAFHELGRLQMEVLNQPAAAFETCLRTAKLFPRDSETHARLLFYYSMTCQHQAVVDECHRAIETGADILPTYAHLLSARWLTYKNGFDMNSLWLRSAPDSELYYVASLVHLISHHGLTEQAQGSSSDGKGNQLPMEFFETKLREGSERYPNNLQLQAVVLARLCQAGDIEAVAKGLATAPPESAEDSRFWRFKGWYHLTMEQWLEAIAAYEKTLELDPFDWLAQHELATALRLSGQSDSATTMQQRATLGKDVARSISRAPRIDAVPENMMVKMAEYMEMCGDKLTAKSLRNRLQNPNTGY
jgi:tetratricopeptide (TPR) repeat protein